MVSLMILNQMFEVPKQIAHKLSLNIKVLKEKRGGWGGVVCLYINCLLIYPVIPWALF